jgi:hypothetical protein
LGEGPFSVTVVLEKKRTNPQSKQVNILCYFFVFLCVLFVLSAPLSALDMPLARGRLSLFLSLSPT